MRSKQITWKCSAALAISTLTILVGSSSCVSLLSSFRNASVATTSVATTQPLRSIQGNSTWVYAIAISPDGRTLASDSADRTVKLWQMPTGKLLHSLIGHDGVVWSVAFSPDGKRLASGSNDNTIKLWGLPEGKLLENLIGHERGVRQALASKGTKWYYITGARNLENLSPDTWTLDQALLDRPGNVDIQLALNQLSVISYQLSGVWWGI
ncbi:WD-repeat protein [Nostoc commune NIES-4072]|uniref:WD-repeat protein n=1 Tax=Nostoc commune NIES-4072 TaxID=2005467 RepID=A0A2R5FPA7_NOSCO|nr:hypothetical protein [Nostoc commune]BBD69700.1 WD-repeat protein [Nostoc commune HK-02]GBG19298.1 WD-repeat protein [Nostoc commune NIES-4072]